MRSLVAVIDEGGFANAAHRLGMAQPTVTGHIQELERAVGTMLVDRRCRPVQLTAAGHTFIRHARLVLSEVDAAMESTVLRETGSSAASGGPVGTVRLGTYPSATCGFIPAFLRSARQELPGVTIVLHEMNGIEMEAAVDARSIDLFLRQAELPLLKRNFLTHRLWQERFIVAIPNGHDWAGEDFEEVPAHLLPRTQLIMTGGFAPELAASHPLWQALGAYPEVLHRVVHPQSLLALVETGLAPGLTTELATKSFPTSARLKAVDHPQARRDVMLYWPSRRSLTPSAQAVIDLLIAQPAPALLRGG